MKYKSCRIIDGRSKWVVVDVDRKILDRNPRKEELLNLINIDILKEKQKYNENDLCDICNEKLIRGNTIREYDDNYDWTGRWMCKNCYNDLPDSYKNLIKSMTDRRTHNQNINHSNAKGDLFEELTCQWRGVKNLNVENNNYCFPIDHSRDSELGIIQTKGRFYDLYNRYWTFNFVRERDKKFDNIICYCTNRDGRIIERIYIFPREEILKRTGITIYKNPVNSRNRNSIIPWYEQYRIRDEETIKKTNDMWKKIMERRK